jgi:DNA-binding MurR/RpiR family transcriptional regulator
MFTPEQIARFSELDYIIYNYVTKHANEVVYMRIRELAEAVHVSPPTILRFCKKVGCDGFSEFKTKLKLYLQQNERAFITNAQDTLTEFFERTLKPITSRRFVKQPPLSLAPIMSFSSVPAAPAF